MSHTIFSTATGQITRVVSVPIGMVSMQLQGPDEDWIEGNYPDDKFYIDGFTPVAIPERPSEHHVFNRQTKQWEDPRTHQTQWPVVRAERDAKLAASDWTQLPDVPLATKEAWAAYRQALRDVTLQSDPFAIDWPVAPGT